MQNHTNIYLDHLRELGRTMAKSLTEDDLINLSSRIIRELPTKHLPHYEPFDRSKEIMLMMSEWMISEDDFLGLQILRKLRDFIIQAIMPEIKDKLDDLALQDDTDQRYAGLHERMENNAFDSHRERV